MNKRNFPVPCSSGIKSRFVFLILSLKLVFGLSACSTLNTDLEIPKKEIPADFVKQQSNVSANIARINWRQFFKEPLLIKLIDTGVTNNIDLQVALQKIEMTRSSVKLAQLKIVTSSEFERWYWH